MTFQEIYQKIQSMAHDDTAETLVKIKAAINEIYDEICNLEDWHWLVQVHEFNTKESNNTGQVSVSPGSLAVIMGTDTEFSADHIGMQFVFPNFPKVYDISNVIDAETLSIDETYQGEDDFGSFLIFEKEISLPTNFRRPFAVKLDDRPLDQKGQREITKRTQSWTPSKPSEYAITVSTLIFNSCPDDKYYCELWFYANPTTLTNNSDQPLIPKQFQQVLVYGGYMRLNDKCDDFEYNSSYEKLYKDVLRNLYANNEKDSDMEDTFEVDHD